MAELIHECEAKVQDAGGVIYLAAVHGEERADGTSNGGAPDATTNSRRKPAANAAAHFLVE